jgi:hypothetical protein
MAKDAFRTPPQGLAFIVVRGGKSFLSVIANDVFYQFEIETLAVSRLACEASDAIRLILPTLKE